jgi:hypothetical protein
MTPARQWLISSLLVAMVSVVACSNAPNAPTPPAATNSPSPVITIRGTVHDMLPSGDGAPVPGAQVQVIYKSASGASVTSGADGTYQIDGVLSATFFQLRASKDGYEANVRIISPLTANSAFDFQLTPIPTTLTGVVTEAAPTEATPVAGATVEILTGSNKGRTTTSDRNGAYSLPEVWGDFDVLFSGTEYDTKIVHASVGTTARLDVNLAPRDRQMHTTLSGDLCTTERLPPSIVCSRPFQRTHTIAVHRPGTLTLNVDYRYVGDYYVNYLNVDVRCGSTVVLEKRVMKIWENPPTILPDGVTGSIRVPLTQACLYELRLSNFIADTKGGYQTTYRVEVDHPQ